MYSFEREADAVVPDLVIHGLDRNFVFGNNFGPPSNYVLNAEDLALFGAIAGYWTRFAAAGSPNRHNGDALRWPASKHPTGHGRGADKYLILDWPLREDKRLRAEQCDFWEPFYLRSIANGPVPASHPADDLEFLVTGTQSAVGNTVARNTLELNTCGLKGPVSGNTIEKNRFEGNGSDSCQ